MKPTCEYCNKELPEDVFPAWCIRFCDDCSYAASEDIKMSAPYEIACSCAHCICTNDVPYIDHRDWSDPSDWACERCVNNCY